MYDGTMTEIPVEDDIRIEPGHKYLFGLQLMNDAGVQPLGIDGNKAVVGKSNMLSTDGKKWYSASISGIDGNFNISVKLNGATDTEEQPVGYNVYRDGVKVNASTVSGTTYDDVLTNTGIHSYTITSVYADGGESQPSEPTSVEAYGVNDKTAPHNLNAIVTRNRQVSLRLDNPTVGNAQTFTADIERRPVTTEAGYPEFVRSFYGPKSGMATATDGKYVYVSIYNEDGRIDKYDLMGNFVASYKIDKIEGIRNLAYDGEWLYVADNTTKIHRVDITTMKNMEDIAMRTIVRSTAQTLVALALALMLPNTASAACDGFADVPEDAACYPCGASAPAAVSSASPRKPHSAPMAGSPALWPVRMSTSLSPTKRVVSGLAPRSAIRA